MASKRRSSMNSTRARIKLRRVLTATDNGIKPTMKKAADDLRDDMKENVPVGDTGTLKDNITSFVAKNGLRAEAGYRGKKAKRRAWYARFIEFGTKAHKIGTYSSPVLSDGANTFGTQASHPGIPARPFIEPAWDKNKQKIQKAVGKVVADAVKEAQKA